MAISKNFFGLRTKSTKSHTYSVFRGVQVTKDRVINVANPQSTGQMSQRLVMPLVSSASSKLRSLIDHSFEGVAYGWPSIYEFQRQNLAKGALKVLSFVPKGFGDCGAANFLVSKGSLESTGAYGTATGPVITFPGAVNADSDAWKNFYSATSTKTTLDADSAAMLAPVLGLQVGDQLTFLCGGQYDPRVNTPAGVCARTKFFISRLILGGERAANENNFKITVGNTGTLTLNDGYLELTLVDKGDDGYVVIALDYADGHDEFSTTPCMSTCIVSRKDGSVWRRSTQRFFIEPNSIPYKLTYDDVLPTYMKPENNSEKYLNSGIEGVNITGGRG